MRVSANHHPGIRVSDIERSAQFYIDALGGHWQTSPMLYEGPDAEMVMGGTPNTRFKVCHIGFDEGTIELFQFLPSGPVDNPIPAQAQSARPLGRCGEPRRAAPLGARAAGRAPDRDTRQ